VKRVAEATWNSHAAWAAMARGVLAPASMAYRAVTSVRNALYDRGTLSVARSAIPVLSIGNLAVGGTGKTPVAAWMASQLRTRGARPGIVMRGYGDDEPRVHVLMNPEVPVIVNADRVAAVREAAASGCDVAILDDAFQHRRIARMEDVVLVSADRWREPVRLLPSGPWREAPSALSRATMLMITRKAADRAAAQALLQRFAPLTRSGAGAVALLELDALHDAVTGAMRPLSDIRGTHVLVAAGIGDPGSLAAQLRFAGARVEMRSFPDHHVYDSSDIARLAREAGGVDHMLCTLKDAVKLGPRWPREAPPLWYVSLRCVIEVGGAEVSALLDRVNTARHSPINQAPGDRRLHDSLSP
jgi:tetraacyldisaccharide 4'-kinase